MIGGQFYGTGANTQVQYEAYNQTYEQQQYTNAMAQYQQQINQREQSGQLPTSLYAEDICVGCIVWLPERSDGKELAKCTHANGCKQPYLNRKGYNHYAVILDVFRQQDGDIKCTIATLTSKEGNGGYSPERIKISQETSASPLDDQDTLYLEEGCERTAKQSYVVLGHVYQVPMSHLRSISQGCPAYQQRFAEESYNHLMKRFGLESAVFEDSADVQDYGATIRTGYPQSLPLVPRRVVSEKRSSNSLSAAAASFVPLPLPKLISPQSDSPTEVSSSDIQHDTEAWAHDLATTCSTLATLSLESSIPLRAAAYVGKLALRRLGYPIQFA